MEPNQSPIPPVNPGGQNTHSGLMATLEYYFVTKAPFQLPAGLKEFIVKFGPWINLLFLLTFIPLILVLVGLDTFLSLFFVGSGHYGGWSILSVLSLVFFVLGVIALPGLFRRKLSGWNFIFYGQIVSLVQNIVSGNVLVGLLSVIISLYFLFQIRSYYH